MSSDSLPPTLMPNVKSAQVLEKAEREQLMLEEQVENKRRTLTDSSKYTSVHLRHKRPEGAPQRNAGGDALRNNVEFLLNEAKTQTRQMSSVGLPTTTSKASKKSSKRDVKRRSRFRPGFTVSYKRRTAQRESPSRGGNSASCFDEFFKQFCPCSGKSSRGIGKRRSLDDRIGKTLETKSIHERAREEWELVDEDKDNNLDFDEVKVVFQRLNVRVPNREIRAWMDKYDEDRNGTLDFAEFSKMFEAIQSRPDLRQEFLTAKILGSGEESVAQCRAGELDVRELTLTPTDLCQFVAWSTNGEEQPTLEECAYRINQLERKRAWQGPPEQGWKIPPEELGVEDVEDRSDGNEENETASTSKRPGLTVDGVDIALSSDGTTSSSRNRLRSDDTIHEDDDECEEEERIAVEEGGVPSEQETKKPPPLVNVTVSSRSTRPPSPRTRLPSPRSPGSASKLLARFRSNSKDSVSSASGTLRKRDRFKNFMKRHRTPSASSTGTPTEPKQQQKPDADNLLPGWHPQSSVYEPPLLSYDMFEAWLTDRVHAVVGDPSKLNQVYQDMSKPLSHYYISSSHNSYLSGNQLNSESTAYAIIRALKLGVRVIELDAWNGPQDEPIVTHGNTLCKPMPFVDCIRALKEYGFVASEYPVIITIENHCNMEQQRKEVFYMESILGDQLYRFPIPDPSDLKVGVSSWASPEDLKGKFVIRDKPNKTMTRQDKVEVKIRKNRRATLESRTLEGAPSVSSDSKSTAESLTKKSMSDIDEKFAEGTEQSDEELIDLNETEDDDHYLCEDSDSGGVTPGLLKIMYIKNISLPIKKLDSGLVVYKSPPYCSSSSVSEQKMRKLARPGASAASLNTYAKTHLLRVYPAGARISSSNYDPVPAWNAGCQIVALNYQSFGVEVWVNQGKFSDNGGCGYVLKPVNMMNAVSTGVIQPAGFPPTILSSDEDADQKGSASKAMRLFGHSSIRFGNTGSPTLPWTLIPGDASYNLDTVTLKIELISGHYLPRPEADSSDTVNPFVEITVRGLEEDDKTFRSTWIENNGFDPTWRETFAFSIHNTELATVSFIVRSVQGGRASGKGAFLGQNCLPLSCVRQGYRCVPLRHANCALTEAGYLLCKFTLTNEMDVV